MKKILVIVLMLFITIYGWLNIGGSDNRKGLAMDTKNLKLESAIFAGGCFWCMEHPFEKLGGVHDVVSDYSGGKKKDPTYKEVSSGVTGHAEAVQIFYDPEKISYEKLLDAFWMQIDPTDGGGSFVDRGSQYRSAIFYHNNEQKLLAEISKEKMDKSGGYDKPIVTEIVAFEEFYKAEAYHQDYATKNPIRSRIYRYSSGRDQYLEKIWGKDEGKSMIKTMDSNQKPSKEKLRKRLTPLQYKVTQEDGTERSFDNEYWDNKEAGIYVDIVSREPLFSSIDKYASGTGWPSFAKPIEPDVVVEKEDSRFFMVRTELRSMGADSHLGHLFNDGPEPTGLRYCINSAALRFIPKEDLDNRRL